MEIVKDKVLVERLSMVSGVGQQSAVQMWDYVKEKDGVTYWFWPSVHDEAGAMVHVGSIMVGIRSEGYGGRTLDFPTKGGVVKIQGPWHSNTDALYERTGVDLRDKHRTTGVVALKRGTEGYETTLLDVVYVDPDGGVVGKFNRIQELAQQMSDESDKVLFYYRRSLGGSSCGPVYPSQWDDQKKREYFYPVKG